MTVGFSVADQIVRPDGAQQGGVPATPGRGAVDASIVGTDYRFASLDLPDASPPAELLALYPSAKIDEANDDLRLRVVLVVLIALGVILVLSEVVVRSITGQLGVYERRAKEVGEGKFAGSVPVHGNDEFAKFAVAFNTMSAELERRIDELENERQRVRRAVGRFGQALEATHDVSALLSIVVESAMEAVRARGGRLLIVDEQTGELVEQVRVGSARDGEEGRLPARIAYGEGVEGLVLQTLRPALQREPEPMVSAPLQSTRSMIGLITLVDPELGQFRDEDGETLQALAAQGAIAIDNARMHRLITKQASTDGLTGLANRREFQDQLRREIERAQRFGLPLALILLDLDDFKLVNDRFGHLAGDSVLRPWRRPSRAASARSTVRRATAARSSRSSCPAPTSEGAARLAERLRVAVAERPATAADGRPVRVTSSFGVAAMPEDATTQVELVAVADGALYAAKEAGKNRVVARRRSTPTGRVGNCAKLRTAPARLRERPVTRGTDSGDARVLSSPPPWRGRDKLGGAMKESSSLFASVIEEHLALKRRNSELDRSMPLDQFIPADPFENHALFKTEQAARREEEETGEHPAVALEWPGDGFEGQAEEAWLDRQQCTDFNWGD